ncbi:Asp-tRNA(Asn)/Glu-tRNA(Gln) amidotransferase subunit GatC [Candidatus Tisiphia endosymbiont of Mystacides longicornis]|uniref:Asp-tRNA(Asn)/Glu-tRNA(Gln) amidotransferase subunit GatC n=1 Tax=Candidatus Tisiphia endosymbiont of Mystacides longicornis TaxID=3139330 RepID=UPI003CCADCA8
MITNEEVQRIAKLARFDFSKEEINSFSQQLTEIMNMINILNDVDCSNVQQLTSVCGMNQRMRKDQVLYGDLSDELFANLPNDKAELAREVKCFVVPKVVE